VPRENTAQHAGGRSHTRTIRSAHSPRHCACRKSCAAIRQKSLPAEALLSSAAATTKAGFSRSAKRVTTLVRSPRVRQPTRAQGLSHGRGVFRVVRECRPPPSSEVCAIQVWCISSLRKGKFRGQKPIPSAATMCCSASSRC